MSVRDDQLDTLKVGGKDYDFYRIADLPGIDHLPYSLKVLVENLVRNIDGANITDDHVKALLDWETIDSEQLDDIMAGKEPRPPKDWTPRTPSSGGDGSGGGTPAVAADTAPTVA